MNIKKLKLFWQGLCLLYLLVTYATLGIMPALWNRIDGILHGNGILFQYVLYSATGMAAAVFLQKRSFFSAIRNILISVVFILVFFLMFYLEKNPGEKIHMFQYGIFGLLLFKALSFYIKTTSMRLYLHGSVICVIAGAVDEVIQYFLPNRVFTWHDVFVNGLSGMMVLLYINYFLRHGETPAAKIHYS